MDANSGVGELARDRRGSVSTRRTRQVHRAVSSSQENADLSVLDLRQVGPIDTYDSWRGWADWVIDIVVEMVGYY